MMSRPGEASIRLVSDISERDLTVVEMMMRHNNIREGSRVKYAIDYFEGEKKADLLLMLAVASDEPTWEEVKAQTLMKINEKAVRDAAKEKEILLRENEDLKRQLQERNEKIEKLEKNNDWLKKRRSPILCFICNKAGHKASNCHEKTGQSESQKDEAPTAESDSLPLHQWYDKKPGKEAQAKPKNADPANGNWPRVGSSKRQL